MVIYFWLCTGNTKDICSVNCIPPLVTGSLWTCIRVFYQHFTPEVYFILLSIVNGAGNVDHLSDCRLCFFFPALVLIFVWLCLFEQTLAWRFQAVVL
jgi:hypothetical protein